MTEKVLNACGINTGVYPEMTVRQVINNNTVFSADPQGNEIIVVGKGIGFHSQKGMEIPESSIEKIFTLKDETEKNKFMLMIEEIPYDVISFGIRATDYIAACCSKPIEKEHLMLPLIDHIYTTLERYKQGIRLEADMLYNIRYLYREEYKIAVDVADMISSAFNMDIDEGEANYITLHIINAELDLDSSDGYKVNNIIQTAVDTAEEFFGITFDKDSMDFARFITHMQFFAQRLIKNTFWDEPEDDMVRMIRYQYKKAYECTKLIISRIEEQYHTKVDEREYMYLTIHIARLLQASGEDI